jgi:hypothetical protein
MSEFKLSEDKIPYICEKLEIKESNEKALVEYLCRDFCYFYHKVRVQHLSSVVAALEYHVRKSNNKKDFTILCLRNIASVNLFYMVTKVYNSQKILYSR